MLKEVKDFKRLELFNYFQGFENPFIILTTQIEVTNVVNYCKKHKNLYATIGYLITKTVNQTEAFKYRYKDGKFYYCETTRSQYTENLSDNTLGFFGVSEIDEYAEYIKEFKKQQKKLLEDSILITEIGGLDEIWLSCTPRLSYTCLVTPINKDITIPQFFWDKYQSVNDRYYVHLTIMIHHGFADGFHISEFVNLLEKNIQEFAN